MSDRAQRVLDALMDFDADGDFKYPMESIYNFLKSVSIAEIIKDYEALTVDEEKQVIKAFLEFAY